MSDSPSVILPIILPVVRMMTIKSAGTWRLVWRKCGEFAIIIRRFWSGFGPSLIISGVILDRISVMIIFKRGRRWRTVQGMSTWRVDCCRFFVTLIIVRWRRSATRFWTTRAWIFVAARLRSRVLVSAKSITARRWFWRFSRNST